MEALTIKINERDNVAVAIRDLKKGTALPDGTVTQTDIPQAHKIALCDIPEGGEVVRYGVVLGTMREDMPRGGWINETNLIMAPAPDLDKMEFATNIVTKLPEPPVKTWMGYPNPWGEGPGGTRNILCINTTVQCVIGVVNDAISRIRRDLLPKYPNVDDVVTVNHQYGCGVAIDAPEAKVPQRLIRNIALHPNFGGEFMLVGLGCEKFTPERFCALWPELNTPENVIILQDHKGHDAVMNAILEMAERKLKHTEDNLFRLRDIVTELEDRVGPLKSQSHWSVCSAAVQTPFPASQPILRRVMRLISSSPAAEPLCSLKLPRCVTAFSSLPTAALMKRWVHAWLKK